MNKDDEMILVLPKEIAIPSDWMGIKDVGLDRFENILREKGQFIRRGEAENDPNWKQIIPYLIFRCKGSYFLMQRTTGGGEARLHNKYSLGIGGHVNKEDLAGDSIVDWARREFEEEVIFKGTFTSKPLGLLYVPDGVGLVHLGYVILLEGDSNKISIRETDKLTGRLAVISEIDALHDQMEEWSQYTIDYIKKHDV